MGEFDGQTAIVTGGTRGIGGAVSAAFLSAGAKVVAVYGGNEEQANKFRERNAAFGDRLEVARVDVADHSAVEEFFNQFESKHKSLEALVNNAGIRRDAVVGMMAEADWRAVLDTNLTGTFNMSKFGVRAMMKNRYGRIINITSPCGEYGFAGQANYAASKAGQVGLTRSLSKEVAGRKITVNCVSPGFIDTDFIGDLPEDMKKAYTNQVPLKRFGTAEEVARLVLFLASRESSYITGSVMEITGGL
ncbi:MAG: 3-oxoacyl-ACP reductase FabG [Nitrospinae bacterium]|nr:3-oxoacyl-ACP reductase FabG [Nitrospinota bacterium]